MKVLRIIIGIILAVVGTQLFCFWLTAGGSLLQLAGALGLWCVSMFCFGIEEDGKCNRENE